MVTLLAVFMFLLFLSSWPEEHERTFFDLGILGDLGELDVICVYLIVRC